MIPAPVGEDALQVSESRLRALVEAVSTGVWRTDFRGHVLDDMPAWRERTRQTREEIAGTGWRAGVHPADRQRVLVEGRAFVRAGSRFATTWRVRPVRGPAPDAAVRWLAVRGAPVRRRGRTVEWFGVYDDVTELREAQSAREQLADIAFLAAERTRALQEVTSALSGAVRASDVLAQILAKGRACTGASGSGVALLEGCDVRYHQLDGYGSDVMATWGVFSPETVSPVPHVLRSGEPLFLSGPEEVLALFDAPPIRAFLQASGEQAMTRLPLRTSAGVVGVLSLGFAERHDFDADERAFLVALANQCAQALDRAWLYERERAHAQVLQRSLLPEVLPEVAGVRLAARCRPATEGTEVGGDWYDALVLPDGRLGVVVGDVMGKGIRAAAVMGQVRNALRGLLHADPSPAVVLTRLDRLVDAMDGDEELVTLVYGVLSPACGTFTWSAAGHPPPLLITAGGVTGFVDHGGLLPLGLGGERSEDRMRLAEGDTVLLFSDGLVETRTRPLLDGLPLLQRRARDLAPQARTLDELADALVAAMAGDSGRGDDDVTVLLVGRDSAAAGSPARRREILLPARPSSAATARRFVREHLAAWGAGELSEAAELCTSEVVTNAVLHTGSPALLGLRADAALVRVEVRDTGRSLPSRRRLATGEDTDGRGLTVLGAVADRWGVREGVEAKTVWFELARERESGARA